MEIISQQKKNYALTIFDKNDKGKHDDNTKQLIHW